MANAHGLSLIQPNTVEDPSVETKKNSAEISSGLVELQVERQQTAAASDETLYVERR